MVITVVGHVMHDIIRMEVAVQNVQREVIVQRDRLVQQHVDDENIVVHELQVIVIVIT